jgi:hypothetical protein
MELSDNDAIALIRRPARATTITASIVTSIARWASENNRFTGMYWFGKPIVGVSVYNTNRAIFSP